MAAGLRVPSHAAQEMTGSSTDGVRVGHLYLDVAHKRLHFLNETAEELHQQGVPFTVADLARKRLIQANGEPLRPEDHPLLRSIREENPVEAEFLLEGAGQGGCRMAWTTSLIRDPSGQILGVLGTVVFKPSSPDWRLLAELAHDLRNPLQVLSVLAAVLESRPEAVGELNDLCQRVRSAAGRAQEIAQDLLEWCRSPLLTRRPLRQAWFRLDSFLENLSHEQEMSAQRKGLKFQVNLQAVQGWLIFSDQVRLGRILANLLSNAINYTQAGQVEFQASWRETGPTRSLVLHVIDTGVGLAPDEQASIFEPFERGQAANGNPSSGSGLGLASVDNLVKELGLHLEVQSELNCGSAFHLIFPSAMLKQVSATQEGTPSR